MWAGKYDRFQGLAPPPNSYGADPSSELAIWLIELQPGGQIDLPAARGGQAVNRKGYFTEGQSLLVGEQMIPPKSSVTFNAGETITRLSNPHASSVAEILVLQGKPIGEPVAQQGPFVMNTHAEIQQAYSDYRKTGFGGWPWPNDAMVFPREKGRFSLQGGKETLPPGPQLDHRNDVCVD